MCGEPIRKKPDIIGLVSLTMVAFITVLLRLLARAPTIGVGSIGMDDCTIIVATVSPNIRTGMHDSANRSAQLLLVPYTVYCFACQ